MAENLTLDEFLKQLASQSGLHRKVRLLARYWRQVQTLPPEARERVALALGSRAAWSRLEILFNRDGTLSDSELAVKRALDSVGRADPRELRAMAQKVRAGDYAGVGKDLAAVVGEALDEEAAALEPQADGRSGSEGSEAQQGDLDEFSPEAESSAEPAAEDLTEQEDLAGQEELAGRRELGEDAGPSAPLTKEPDADAKAPADEPDPDTEAPVELAAEEPPGEELGANAEAWADPEAEAPAVAREPSTETAAKGEASAGPSAEPLGIPGEKGRRGIGTLSAAESLAELRHLRELDDYGDDLGPEGRAHLLARLGPGWAGRRGLSQLIRSGSIGDLDEALLLIARLETPAQRSWCLGDLVEHWDLGEAETASVLAAAPSPATRRRLQSRATKRIRAG